MNFRVILHIVEWYALISVSGLIFWLSFYKYFTKLSDFGFAISKIIALAIPIFFLWTFGFIFKLPITNITSIVFFLIFYGICIAHKVYFKIAIPQIKWKKIIFIEISFLVVLGIGLFITSIHPAIDNVTERLMDINLLNVNTTNSNLPAVDTWLYPNSVNYYYFGHFFYSVINKVTFTDPFMGYLLAMSFTYGLAGTVLFSLGYSIKKSYRVAILCVAFPLLFSNFSFIWGLSSKYLALLTDNDEQKIKFYIFWLDLALAFAIAFSLTYIRKKETRLFLLICIPILFLHFYMIGGFNVGASIYTFLIDPTKANLWYPDVSRVVDSMINEFPFYSIVIGDLHPHFLDLIFLPSLLTLLYLDYKLLTPRKIIRLLTKVKRNNNNSVRKGFINLFIELFKHPHFKTILFTKVITLVIFSVGIVTNSWELICFGILVFVKDVIVIFRLINITIIDDKFHVFKFFTASIFLLGLDLFAFGGGVFTQLPYLRSVSSPIKGIKLNLVNNSQNFFDYFKSHYSFLPTNWAQINQGNITVGLDTILVVSFVLISIFLLIRASIKKKISQLTLFISSISIIGLSIVIGSFLATLISYVQHNFDLSPFYQYFEVWIMFYAFAAIGLTILIRRIIKKTINQKEYFVFTLFITGIILSIFTEFFYVAEFFDRAVYTHHRPNTVFKVNYIGFVFFGIACAWCVYELYKAKSWQKLKVNNEIKYAFSAIISFIRACITIASIIIFLYVPYAVYQWMQFFSFNINQANIKFFIPISYLLILFILGMFALRFKLFYKLKKHTKYIIELIILDLLVAISFIMISEALAIILSKDYKTLLSVQPEIAFDVRDNNTFRLDGAQATRDKYPEIIDAANYLKSQKTKDDVLLEADGSGYKLTAVGAVYSTIPTILGWWGHEAQWREVSDRSVLDKWNPYTDISTLENNPSTTDINIDAFLNQKVSDITSMYNMTTGWQNLISKYKITYVWIGETEREKYTANVTTRFDNITCFNKVYDNGTTGSAIRIYKIDRDCLSKLPL